MCFHKYHKKLDQRRFNDKDTVGTAVLEVVITSSPLLTPTAIKASFIASVPLPTPTPYLL